MPLASDKAPETKVTAAAAVARMPHGRVECLAIIVLLQLATVLLVLGEQLFPSRAVGGRQADVEGRHNVHGAVWANLIIDGECRHHRVVDRHDVADAAWAQLLFKMCQRLFERQRLSGGESGAVIIHRQKTPFLFMIAVEQVGRQSRFIENRGTSERCG